jgi:hypothetical protein
LGVLSVALSSRKSREIRGAGTTLQVRTWPRLAFALGIAFAATGQSPKNSRPDGLRVTAECAQTLDAVAM